MAVIKSGATADNLTVDPTSKAARVSLYDAAGTPMAQTYTGTFATRIECIPNATTIDFAYFTMRNTGAKVAYIRSINLTTMFTGTGAASRSLFKLERFNTATPSGGTVGTAIKRDTSLAAASVGDIRYSASGPITTTGCVFEAPFFIWGVINAPTPTATVSGKPVVSTLEFDKGGEEGRFVLAVGEGLALRTHAAIVVGAAVVGSVSWDER